MTQVSSSTCAKQVLMPEWQFMALSSTNFCKWRLDESFLYEFISRYSDMIHKQKVTASLLKGLLVPHRFLRKKCPRLIKFASDQKTGLVDESFPNCQQEVWSKMTRWNELMLLHKIMKIFLAGENCPRLQNNVQYFHNCSSIKK